MNEKKIVYFASMQRYAVVPYFYRSESRYGSDFVILENQKNGKVDTFSKGCCFDTEKEAAEFILVQHRIKIHKLQKAIEEMQNKAQSKIEKLKQKYNV